jgi:hypothetical protein
MIVLLLMIIVVDSVVIGHLINSMDQSSWEGTSHSASQEIPRFLWNPKVH